MLDTAQPATITRSCVAVVRVPRIQIECANCGSNDCGRDATAHWDEEEQDWLLGGVHDNSFCNACGRDDPGLVEVEIPEDQNAAAEATNLPPQDAAAGR